VRRGVAIVSRTRGSCPRVMQLLHELYTQLEADKPAAALQYEREMDALLGSGALSANYDSVSCCTYAPA
jgi:hypothetical protein